MYRPVPIAALAVLAGCAAAGPVPGDSSLSGQDLSAAVALYGPWEDHAVLAGVDTYIWRRRYRAADKTDYYCELRIQMGFRTTVSRVQMQGYSDACRLFSVRYQSAQR